MSHREGDPSGDEKGRPVRILITVDEWRAITEWMCHVLERTEKSPHGHLLLECEGESRTWVSSDGIHTAVFRCDGPAPQGIEGSGERFAVLVNSRFFRRSRPQDAVLTVEMAGEGRVQTMESSGVTMTLPEHPGEFVDWRSLIESATGTPFEVDVESLLAACLSASLTPFGVDSTDTVHTWVWIRDGRLRLHSPWIEFPGTELSVPVHQHVTDTVPVLLNISRLISLLTPIVDERCTVRLPATDPMGLVSIRAGGYDAVIEPTDRWGEERERVEALLREFLNVESVETDGDGDYPVATPEGHHLWVRMLTDVRPVTVQVFGVLAQPVEASAGLFEELNSINSSAPHVKVLWAADAVMAEVDLLAGTIDMAELRNALEVVRDTADRYYDVLNAYFGSPTAQSADDN